MLFIRLAVFATLLAGPALAADPPPPTAAAADQPAPTVTVSPAVRAEVQSRVPLSGTLVARQEVQVFPQVTGFEIVALNAEAGERVEKGDELARLSDTTLLAQLAQAQAEYLRAEAGVSQAQSQIASSEAASTQTATALERARQLKRGGNTSQAALDQAVAAEAGARAAAASARDGLAVARAALAQAEAARGIARLNVDRTRIVAPVSGLVTVRSAELGALSSSAAGPMFVIIAQGTVEMRGEVIETALLDLKLGDPVQLQVAGVGAVSGKVRLLPPSVDATTRLGEVLISLPADDRLRPGLFASGSVETARRVALTVPASAVLSDQSGEHVQVVANGVVDTREVKAGLLWDERREILDGLRPDEQVITRAGAFFSAGDVVNAVVTPAAVQPDAAQETPAPLAQSPDAAMEKDAAVPDPNRQRDDRS